MGSTFDGLIEEAWKGGRFARPQQRLHFPENGICLEHENPWKGT